MSSEKQDLHPVQKYYYKQVKKIMGWRVSGFVVNDSDPENLGFYGIQFTDPETGKHKTAWVQADEEGNGPGAFMLED